VGISLPFLGGKSHTDLEPGAPSTHSPVSQRSETPILRLTPSPALKNLADASPDTPLSQSCPVPLHSIPGRGELPQKVHSLPPRPRVLSTTLDQPHPQEQLFWQLGRSRRRVPSLLQRLLEVGSGLCILVCKHAPGPQTRG